MLIISNNKKGNGKRNHIEARISSKELSFAKASGVVIDLDGVALKVISRPGSFLPLLA